MNRFKLSELSSKIQEAQLLVDFSKYLTESIEGLECKSLVGLQEIFRGEDSIKFRRLMPANIEAELCSVARTLIEGRLKELKKTIDEEFEKL